MKNEVEQIAQQNDMSIEFVTWFFNEKKANCGNVWFMMMAAMWEGWKGRSIEMDKLAAENVQIKAMNDCLSEELRGYESDGTFEGPKMHLLWWQVETPATDAYLAGIKADGVEEFAAKLRIPGDDQFFDALAKGVALAADDFAKQLREGADK
ncbi:hypothetical protein FMJ41_13350 [Klebsiella michiganensis]|nr:hypothetical protein [Klebsiella michiganensis]MBE0200017.1 hypothetical protein [Klebsiella michiganensis]MBZ6644491.1 hypothetical protein [Klebsiella michiganensis]